MKFRNSIYYSLAGHVLIAGAAIAAAHYTGGMPRSGPDAISVSLVSPARGASGNSDHREERLRALISDASDLPVELQPLLPKEVPANEIKIPSPLRGEDQGERQSNREYQEVRNGHTGTDAGGEGQTPVAIAGQEGQGPRGLIAPEDWAIIVAAIDRTKNYPRLARERGIEGVVRLRFKLNADGDVETMEVVKSSGYEILDKASIRAVYQAVPLPRVKGWVEMPIKYVLK